MTGVRAAECRVLRLCAHQRVHLRAHLPSREQPYGAAPPVLLAAARTQAWLWENPEHHRAVLVLSMTVAILADLPCFAASCLPSA